MLCRECTPGPLPWLGLAGDTRFIDVQYRAQFLRFNCRGLHVTDITPRPYYISIRSTGKNKRTMDIACLIISFAVLFMYRTVCQVSMYRRVTLPMLMYLRVWWTQNIVIPLGTQYTRVHSDDVRRVIGQRGLGTAILPLRCSVPEISATRIDTTASAFSWFSLRGYAELRFVSQENIWSVRSGWHLVSSRLPPCFITKCFFVDNCIVCCQSPMLDGIRSCFVA